MADTARSYLKYDTQLRLGDALPRIEGYDFSDRPGRPGDNVTVAIGDGPVADLRISGPLAQHRALIAAYLGQLDKVETQRTLATEPPAAPEPARPLATAQVAARLIEGAAQAGDTAVLLDLSATEFTCTAIRAADGVL
jgi:hypothetical protein